MAIITTPKNLKWGTITQIKTSVADIFPWIIPYLWEAIKTAFLSQPKWKIWHVVFPCPALVGYCSFCEARRLCLQPSHRARSLLQSEGCRCEAEVCHEAYRGSSNLNKYVTSFHKGKRNETTWKTSEWAQSRVTSPVLHTPLQSAVQSSPHCCQPRKILLLCWEPPRILSWLVKCFLTYLLGVCGEVKLTATSWGQRCIIRAKYNHAERRNIKIHFLWPQQGSSGWLQSDEEENRNMTT